LYDNTGHTDVNNGAMVSDNTGQGLMSTVVTGCLIHRTQIYVKRSDTLSDEKRTENVVNISVTVSDYTRTRNGVNSNDTMSDNTGHMMISTVVTRCLIRQFTESCER